MEDHGITYDPFLYVELMAYARNIIHIFLSNIHLFIDTPLLSIYMMFTQRMS